MGRPYLDYKEVYNISDDIFSDIVSYVKHFNSPSSDSSSFVVDVISNDLAGAVFTATDEELANLKNIVRFVTEVVPDDMRGSWEKYREVVD